MGSRREWESSRHFTLYFESHYHNVAMVDGVKVLQYNDRPNSALPEYAKTSEAYLSINREGEILHLRIYKDHFPVMEIDIGHWQHYGKSRGYVHVHDYAKGSDGYQQRLSPGRDITPAEEAKYGKILMHMKGTLK